jgi:TctA family transporter
VEIQPGDHGHRPVGVRRTIGTPVIFVLCTAGWFAFASRLFDLYVMAGTGTAR